MRMLRMEPSSRQNVNRFCPADKSRASCLPELYWFFISVLFLEEVDQIVIKQSVQESHYSNFTAPTSPEAQRSPYEKPCHPRQSQSESHYIYIRKYLKVDSG